MSEPKIIARYPIIEVFQAEAGLIARGTRRIVDINNDGQTNIHPICSSLSYYKDTEPSFLLNVNKCKDIAEKSGKSILTPNDLQDVKVSAEESGIVFTEDEGFAMKSRLNGFITGHQDALFAYPVTWGGIDGIDYYGDPVTKTGNELAVELVESAFNLDPNDPTSGITWGLSFEDPDNPQFLVMGDPALYAGKNCQQSQPNKPQFLLMGEHLQQPYNVNEYSIIQNDQPFFNGDSAHQISHPSSVIDINKNGVVDKTTGGNSETNTEPSLNTDIDRYKDLAKQKQKNILGRSDISQNDAAGVSYTSADYNTGLSALISGGDSKITQKGSQTLDQLALKTANDQRTAAYNAAMDKYNSETLVKWKADCDAVDKSYNELDAQPKQYPPKPAEPPKMAELKPEDVTWIFDFTDENKPEFLVMVKKGK